jgi:putative ABC transport system permease protein
MLRMALLSARGRFSTFAGAFIALLASSALMMAGGMPLEAALRSHPPVERYSGAAAVVTGDQMVGVDNDVPLAERARVSSDLVNDIKSVPGVKAAVTDNSVPAAIDGRKTVVHGWSSAQLTPFVIKTGRAPESADEVVTGFPAKVGSQVQFASTEAARTVTVVGVASPSHRVTRQKALFMTDAEVDRLGGHPGTVDAIGVIGSPSPAALAKAAGKDAVVSTGHDRGTAEFPELQANRVELIAVTAAFGGLALFIAIFVVASTMGLSIQQREREIALLRAVAATPGQIRRMILWEALLVGVLASVAGVFPGAVLGRKVADGLIDHGIAPSYLDVHAGWLPMSGAIGGGIACALLAVWAASRRAARVAPTLALSDASIEPRLLGPGRLIGGLISLAGAAPLLAVATTTSSPATAAATSEMTALFLVAAVGFLGPIVARFVASIIGPPLERFAPTGGFLASANLRTATRRFSSASTPLVLTVAMSCTLLFSATTTDHAVSQERHAAVQSDLAITGAIPASALAEVRDTPGVKSALGLTPTALGPSLGVSDDAVPAAVVDGGPGGLDVDVTAGSLNDLHGDAIALGEERAKSAHAGVGDRVTIRRGDNTRTEATVVAIYDRSLAAGEALVAPEVVAGHQSDTLIGSVLVQADDPAAVTKRLRGLAARYPGVHVGDRASLTSATDGERAMNRWLAPVFVLIIFAFTAIAVVNTLAMIALQRGRELALLRLVGGTARQVRSMARWEAGLIVAIGLGVGLLIAASALVPLSHALTGSAMPYVPIDQLGAILGVSALLAVLALALPTRRVLRTRPIEAIGGRE